MTKIGHHIDETAGRITPDDETWLADQTTDPADATPAEDPATHEEQTT